MAKHTSKPAGSDTKGRPAPYTKDKKGGKAGKAKAAPAPSKKARVEVRYEGAAPASAGVKRAREVVEIKEEPSEVASSSVLGKANGKGKARATSPPADIDTPVRVSPGSFVVIAGSYEKLLYGIEGSYASSSSSTFTHGTEAARPDVAPVFIFPAHLAYVKCIAASPGGKWLATGSEDEFIKVWDLRRRKEVGSLSQHSGMSSLLPAVLWHLWASTASLLRCMYSQSARRLRDTIWCPTSCIYTWNLPTLAQARPAPAARPQLSGPL